MARMAEKLFRGEFLAPIGKTKSPAKNFPCRTIPQPPPPPVGVHSSTFGRGRGANLDGLGGGGNAGVKGG